MPTLKAMPGRLILRFPPPVKQHGAIYIPETSQQRPEFGEIHDVGEPLDDEQRIIATRLRELKKAGKKLAVSFISGVRYYQENLQHDEEWAWLKDYRSYSLSEPAAYLEE